MSVIKDPNNANVHVTVSFTSDDAPPRIQSKDFFGVDIDRVIYKQITNYIGVLRRQDAAFDAMNLLVGKTGQG